MKKKHERKNLMVNQSLPKKIKKKKILLPNDDGK